MYEYTHVCIYREGLRRLVDLSYVSLERSEAWCILQHVLATGRLIIMPMLASRLRVCLFSHCDNTKSLCTRSVALNGEKARKVRVCLAFVTRALHNVCLILFWEG